MKLFVISILLISLQSFDCHHGRTIASSRLNFFDIELLRYASEDKTGNVLVSPASIKTTLAMLLEGAKDDTANEIRRALRLSTNPEDRKMELHLYLHALQSKPNMLESANGVFVSRKLSLRKDFENTIKRDFSAELNQIDFQDVKKSVDLINHWVNEKTHGTIPTIVESAQLATTSQIIIANALYFNSNWKYSFDPLRTKPDCFLRSGICQKVAMMEMQRELPYAYINELKAHALELPYEGSRHSMIILLPLEADGSEALIRDLPFMSLAQIHDKMHLTDVTLQMPKFTVDITSDMVQTLQKMHINSLFSPRANLSGIFDVSSASVNGFQHKVHVSVDEIGTVAAAVSSAVVVPLSFSGVEIKVDKPFVFLIRDNDQGIILFEGKIEEPTVFEENKARLQSGRPLAPVLPVVTTGTVEPNPILNNRPREVQTPIVFPRSDINIQSPPPITTEKSNGFFSSVKGFFG